MNHVEALRRHPEVAKFEDLSRKISKEEAQASRIILTSRRTKIPELKIKVEELIKSGEDFYLADLDGLGNETTKDFMKKIRERGYMTIEFFARMWPDDPGDSGYWTITAIKPVYV